MPPILLRYWQSWSIRTKEARERRLVRSFQKMQRECACGSTLVAAEEPGGSSRAERLEHIALYAQAGYFATVCSGDHFQTLAEAPPQ
jgi:DNA repair photolyase